MRTELPAGELLELFAAAPPDARRLCLLAGQGGGGFQDTLTWDPAAVLEGQWQGETRLREELSAFVQRHSEQGRLVLGHCSYDLGHLLHGLPLRPRAGPRLPDYCWLAYDHWLERSGDVWSVEAKSARFLEQLQAARLRAPHAAAPASRFEPMRFRALLSAEQYQSAFERIAEYIRAGDIYQVNLAHELRAQTELAPRQLFPFVARANPVEHLAYLEGQGYALHSASPERFARIRDRRIETLPIKGTRPRGANAEQDRARVAELLASEKEAAELNMITDLLRNDLAAVCEPGSVAVAEHRVPRAGPRVWHTASRITGHLRRGLEPFDAVLRMQPGGSISGCPKRRALEIIDELELGARGAYTGVIGRIAPDGEHDFSIAIRTLIQRGREVSLSVGGGIVYDSDVEQELEETRLKAESFAQLPAVFQGV